MVLLDHLSGCPITSLHQGSMAGQEDTAGVLILQEAPLTLSREVFPAQCPLVQCYFQALSLVIPLDISSVNRPVVSNSMLVVNNNTLASSKLLPRSSQSVVSSNSQ